MTEPTAQDVLMGGGGRTISWADKDQMGRFITKPYGTSYEGFVMQDGANLTPSQQTDYNTGALLTWNDGKPKLQIFIPIQTQLREDPQDDGKRTLVVKQSSALQAAIRDAVERAGAKGLQQGGYLKVTLTGEVPGQGSPRKTFEAVYTPAAQGVVMGQGQTQGQPQQGQQVPQQPAQPQYQQPQAPAPQQFQGQPQQPAQPQYQQPQGQGPAPQQFQAPQQAPAPQQFQPPAPQAQVPQQFQAPAPQQGGQAPAGPNPVDIAKKLLAMNLSPEQVAESTGLTVEQVKQIPPY
jgi:hypothetical protein